MGNQFIGIGPRQGEPEVKLCGFFLTVEADERDDLVLKRTTDLGKTFTTIHEDIYSFGYIGAFLFFSVMEDSVRWLKIRCGASMLLCTEHHQTGVSLLPQRSPRVMYFSSDQGESFSRALLPSASTEQVRSIKAQMA